MFLTKDNHIKWKWMAIAAGVVAALCLMGIFWFDIPLYLYLRQFDWAGWIVFDAMFGFKVWLAVSFIVAVASGVAFYVKKMGQVATNSKGTKNTIKNKEQSKNKDSFFTNLIKFFKKIWNFIVKTKNSFIKFIKSISSDSSILSLVARSGLFVFSSVLLAGIITSPLKFIFGRMRPVFLEALDKTGFVPFTNDWAFNSFPSGHAAASFAGLVMLGLLFPRIKWATWTLAIIIGISRVFIGDHFLGDVLAGAFIGMAAADLVKFAFAKIAQKR